MARENRRRREERRFGRPERLADRVDGRWAVHAYCGAPTAREAEALALIARLYVRDREEDRRFAPGSDFLVAVDRALGRVACIDADGREWAGLDYARNQLAGATPLEDA